MNKIKIHLQNKESAKVAVKNLGEYLYIAGYECDKCENCHLYGAGDGIEEERWCDMLVTREPNLELKIQYNEGEEIRII